MAVGLCIRNCAKPREAADHREPVLRYFDNTKEITLQCDASESGLGAVIMQESQPVAFSSRALTNTERNYAQIEKELLSIVGGSACAGRSVCNYYPNRSQAFGERRSQAPWRLQRMLLQLQRYHLKVVYKPGKELLIAITLSRAYLLNEPAPEKNN